MKRLKSSDPGFAKAFARIVADRREADDDVSRDVANIIDRVKADGDAALAQAAEADRRAAQGARRGPLDGVPFGVKDTILSLIHI